MNFPSIHPKKAFQCGFCTVAVMFIFDMIPPEMLTMLPAVGAFVSFAVILIVLGPVGVAITRDVNRMMVKRSIVRTMVFSVVVFCCFIVFSLCFVLSLSRSKKNWKIKKLSLL